MAADPASCTGAIAISERAERLPTQVLGAIGIVESGRIGLQIHIVTPWPWTINVADAGYVFNTVQDAIAAVQAVDAGHFLTPEFQAEMVAVPAFRHQRDATLGATTPVQSHLAAMVVKAVQTFPGPQRAAARALVPDPARALDPDYLLTPECRARWLSDAAFGRACPIPALAAVATAP